MKELYAISEKLDYSLQISLGVSQEMGLLFAKLEEAIPMYASLTDDSAQVSLYLDRQQKNKFEPLLGRITHTSKGTYDIYNMKAEELLSEFQIFRKISRIPSVVPGGLYLKNGLVYADFRFHHSSLKQINDSIREIADSDSKIKLTYLGRSIGLVSTIMAINNRIPLTLITFSYQPENEYMNQDELAGGPVAEAKLFSTGMGSEYDVVYYATKVTGSGTPIDISGGIYESKFKTGFIRKFMGNIQKNKIPIASIVGIYHAKSVDTYVFVPYFITEEMLQIIFESARDTDNKTLNITGFENVSDLDKKYSPKISD